MGNVIGVACGALAVVFVLFSIWAATRGGGEGMATLLVGFALLLIAVGTLRPSRTGA